MTLVQPNQLPSSALPPKQPLLRQQNLPPLPNQLLCSILLSPCCRLLRLHPRLTSMAATKKKSLRTRMSCHAPLDSMIASPQKRETSFKMSRPSCVMKMVNRSLHRCSVSTRRQRLQVQMKTNQGRWRRCSRSSRLPILRTIRRSSERRRTTETGSTLRYCSFWNF